MARLCLRTLVGCALVLLAALTTTLAQTPPPYDEWDAGDCDNLNQKLALLAEPGQENVPLYIFLQPSDVDCVIEGNPIEVKRPLFLHGGNALATRIVAENPFAGEPQTPQPLFIVKDNKKLSIAGVTLGAQRPHSLLDPSDPEYPPNGECAGGMGCCGGCPCFPAVPTTVLEDCAVEADPCSCIYDDYIKPLSVDPDPANPPPMPVYEPNQIAIRFDACEGCESRQFELYDAHLSHSQLLIQGQGTFRLQGVVVTGAGHVTAGVVVDHPGAHLIHVGGEYSGGHYSPPWPDVVDGPIYHVWQKRGRLELYGLLPVYALGNADFRIDTATADGSPHVLAGIRSEGIDLAQVPYPSSLVYVPPSTEPVNVLLKANNGAWVGADDAFKGSSHFIDYNAAGTVWLVGNYSPYGAGRLAIGNAPQAKIVALGNVTYNKEILPSSSQVSERWINAATRIGAGNLYNYVEAADCPRKCSIGGADCEVVDSYDPCVTSGNGYCLPDPDAPAGCDLQFQFVEQARPLSDFPLLPRVPEVTVPEPLVRPHVGGWVPGMVDVTDCGANPGDDQDDYDAIMRAFRYAATGVAPQGCPQPGNPQAQCTGTCTAAVAPSLSQVFLPAGTFDVRRPLIWHFPTGSSSVWLAGVGGDCTNPSQCTTLRNLSAPSYDFCLPFLAYCGEVLHNVCQLSGNPLNGTTCDGTATDPCIVAGGTCLAEIPWMELKHPNCVDECQGVLRLEAWNSTIQGIHFESDPYAVSQSGQTELSKEATVQVENGSVPSQNIWFHDCVFDGGKYALGHALHSPIQCDKMVIARSKFKNAKVGYAQAGQNALGNLIYDYDPGNTTPPTFQNNQYNFGGPDICNIPAPCCGITVNACVGSPPHEATPDNWVSLPSANAPWCPNEVAGRPLPCKETPADLAGGIGGGGEFHILGARTANTAIQDLRGQQVWVHQLHTDTRFAKLGCDPGSSGGAGIVLFDQVTYDVDIDENDPVDRDRPMFDWRHGGGLIFLHTKVGPDFKPPFIYLQALSSAYAMNIDGPQLWRGLRQPSSGQALFLNRLYERQWVPCPPACNDGLTCTTDTCGSDGFCRFTPTCNDGKQCTVDDCRPREDGVPGGYCINTVLKYPTPPGGYVPRADAECYGYDVSAFYDPACNTTPCHGRCDLATSSSGCVTPDLLNGPECETCEPTLTCGPGCSAGHPCTYTDQGLGCLTSTGTVQTCFDGDYNTNDLTLKDCPCAGLGSCSTTNSETLVCRCDTSSQCQDDLYCNGQESCTTSSCLSGTLPCTGGMHCYERDDECLIDCGQAECATPPSGCTPVDTEATTCMSPYGAIHACPPGETIHKVSCACNGSPGSTSWYCAPS